MENHGGHRKSTKSIQQRRQGRPALDPGAVTGQRLAVSRRSQSEEFEHCARSRDPVYPAELGEAADEAAFSRARSSAGEHYLDMVGVTGSIPVAPTIKINNLNDLTVSAIYP